MTNRLMLLTLCAFLFIFMNACTSSYEPDNQTSGHIQISVDDTYKPLMEEQLKVFRSRFPNATIDVRYKPEADCIKDFLEDTTRVIFVTRELNTDEIEYAKSKNIVPKSMAMARDAITFITSKANNNPQYTMQDLRDILTGKNDAFQVVFDNKNSSTVRYINDSILKGNQLSEKCFAANSCEEVIDYVAKHDKTIGVIGVSWIADTKDSLTEQFLNVINVAAIKPDSGALNSYIKPYQAYIGLREYPCTRNFYFISKETWQGLGTGLVNYLCRDGQLVFKHSKLFPLRVNVMLRETKVNQ